MMTRRPLSRFFLLGSLGCCVLVPVLLRAADSSLRPPKPRESETAHRVDQALLRALGPSAALPPLADDATFLRRLSLDLTGKVPTSDEVRQFTTSADPDKRAHQIDRYLASEAYAVNWARYWRDTVTYHTPASANYLRWKQFDDNQRETS